MGIIRHIKFAISDDLTCWAESMEDFENDTEEKIRKELIDFIVNDTGELLDGVEITEVFYEEE